MADEADSKSVVRKGVWVRIPLPAPELGARICAFFYCQNSNSYQVIGHRHFILSLVFSFLHFNQLWGRDVDSLRYLSTCSLKKIDSFRIALQLSKGSFPL